jgi:hypothetical protein
MNFNTVSHFLLGTVLHIVLLNQSQSENSKQIHLTTNSQDHISNSRKQEISTFNKHPRSNTLALYISVDSEPIVNYGWQFLAQRR